MKLYQVIILRKEDTFGNSVAIKSFVDLKTAEEFFGWAKNSIKEDFLNMGNKENLKINDFKNEFSICNEDNNYAVKMKLMEAKDGSFFVEDF